MQALIDYNSQHLPELRLLYHNSTRCKWIFLHNLNFLRKKPFIFIKNYTFYFGKYIILDINFILQGPKLLKNMEKHAIFPGRLIEFFGRICYDLKKSWSFSYAK